MYDFNSLSQEILNRKAGLTRTSLNELVEQKKKTVGGGYLTDQGALFLVAGDLGVQLQRDDSSDLTLKDLYIGANDITVVARVLAVYPMSSYVKREGGEGRYRRLALFDKDATARLTIWENLDVVEKLGLKPDIPVRVVSAYVKKNLDGTPVLNVGKKGKIEILGEEGGCKIPSLSNLTKDVGSIDVRELVAVHGKVKSDSKTSNFTRKDGSQGTMTHFVLQSENEANERRIVIWGGIDLPLVRVGERVRVTNLRQSRQSYGDPELHGDSGSMIEILSVGSSNTPFLILSRTSGRESIDMVVSDAGKTVSCLSLRNSALESGRDLKEGDAIEVVGGRQSGDILVCDDEKCVKLAPKKSALLPSMQSLLVKVKDVGGLRGPQILEVIALSKAMVRDARTTDGSMVRKAELSVGDDTGEITTAAWRESTIMLEDVKEGERLWLIGVTIQKSRMNTPMLELNRWSRVVRVNGSAVSTDGTLGLRSS